MKNISLYGIKDSFNVEDYVYNDAFSFLHVDIKKTINCAIKLV